jgi:hypothetical protein
MASEKQIAANRLNSQKSTGPRSDAGKSTSRMNALQSGIHAESHIIRGEDPEALAQLAAEYNAEFYPVTPRQRDLVDTIVHNEWKIRRLRTIEADIWALQFHYNDEMFSDPTRSSHAQARRHALATAFDDLDARLDHIQRRLHAYERSTTRAMRQLRDLQLVETEPPSAEIGFVPPPPVEQPFQVAMPAFEPAFPGERRTPAQPPTGFVPSSFAQCAPAPDPRPPAPASEASPRPCYPEFSR